METVQLNVLDLPRDNILEVLPRFSIGAKYDDAIAQFATLINEVRLDQLPQELAGHGKSDHHTQVVLPVEIKFGDRPNCDRTDERFLEDSDSNNNLPEIPSKPKTQGYVEDYFVIGKNKKVYFYKRYVYIDDKNILRHHHIPNKQTEAIATMWSRGASPKEICTALGKICKSKYSDRRNFAIVTHLYIPLQTLQIRMPRDCLQSFDVYPALIVKDRDERSPRGMSTNPTMS